MNYLFSVSIDTGHQRSPLRFVFCFTGPSQGSIGPRHRIAKRNGTTKHDIVPFRCSVKVKRLASAFSRAISLLCSDCFSLVKSGLRCGQGSFRFFQSLFSLFSKRFGLIGSGLRFSKWGPARNRLGPENGVSED